MEYWAVGVEESVVICEGMHRILSSKTFLKKCGWQGFTTQVERQAEIIT